MNHNGDAGGDMMSDVGVLIVGGGASGLTASMLLSLYGIRSLLVSKHPETSNLPKAHLLMQKTMEIFHETGVADAIYARGTPSENWRYVGWYAGLAGPGSDYGREIARLEAWSGGFRDLSWQAASPRAPANLPQYRLEPLLKARAAELAPDSVRFNHNFLSFDEDAGGINATIEDRVTQHRYAVRAQYLLACDGGRTVGPQLGITHEGSAALATNTSIHFSADLSEHARDSEVLIRAILNPDLGFPGVLVPMGPDSWGPNSAQWVFHLISMPGDHTLFDDDAAITRMLKVLGLPGLKLTVHVINRWPLDAVVASRFRVGRAFIVGDAAHRMPPTGGHGLNTAVQDAYNISWKLAAVLRGFAAEALLDTYESERRPVAQATVAAALDNWGNQRHLTPVIGFAPQNTPEQNWNNVRRVWAPGPAADRVRCDLREGLAKLLPTYNHLGINFGYTYGSAAAPARVYQPSTLPGHSLPHAWLEDLHGHTALADLVGSGNFVLIAGEDGEEWCRAARALGTLRKIPVVAFTVGTRRGDWMDMRFEWMRQRDISATGALLVRPDRFIAWRAQESHGNVAAELGNAFDQLLGHPGFCAIAERITA